MIKLRKLNGKEFLLNCERIESAEETPDTVITTIDGKKIVVIESIEEITQKVIEYKRNIHFPTKTEG